MKREIQKIGIQVAALNLILLILLGLAIARMTRPIGALKNSAASIAKGDYELELNIRQNDEIGELAQSFNVMKEGIRKKIKDLRELNSTGEELSVCNNQALALEKALQALSVHSGVKFGSIYLFNQNDQLELQAYYPPKIVPEDNQARRFSVGEGAIGASVKSGQILYIPDTSQSEDFASDQDDNGRALICVPLMDRSICIGAMNLSGDIDTVTFEETDFEYAETIARQLVTTIKNIRMRETIEEQNRTLEMKVEQRTAELKQKNNDIQAMLNNMQQGLFTINEEGKIHSEYSAYLETVFETHQVANQPAFDFLFGNAQLGSNELDQARVAIDALLGQDEMMFSFNDHLLIKEYHCTINGSDKILTLDWNPIISDGLIAKLMVTVRDVTQLKALEAEAEHQRRELELISQILAISEEKFVGFIRTLKDLTDENQAIIESNKQASDDVVALLFRNMHTLKGNARTYGLSQMSDLVHEVEAVYSAIRNNEAEWDQQRLLEDLDRVRQAASEYIRVHTEVLGRSDPQGGLDRKLELDPDQLILIQNCIKETTQAHPEIIEEKTLQPIESLINRLNRCPAEEVLSDIIKSLPSLAEELNKPAPKVVFDKNEVDIPRAYGDLLLNVFSHLFRNSLDHGIEPPEIRSAKGKPPAGSIHLAVTECQEGFQIRLLDDGAGINLDALFNKGVEQGKWRPEDKPTDQEIANLVFESGVSTKEQVTSISGRGVGMDAVRQFIKNQGGDIRIELLGERSADNPCVPFQTLLTLPVMQYESVA